MIKTRRIYDRPEADDGFRILVDRIWCSGLKKNDVKIDLWQKDIAPSSALRKWFNHDKRKWNEFKSRYYEELKDKQEIVKLFLEKTEEGTITLLYSSKEEKYNNAIALKEFLQSNRL
ncbi:MAG: DUF488 domain-containing protein [Nitrososphaerales archaeon]